jgi:hypothetical protein
MITDIESILIICIDTILERTDATPIQKAKLISNAINTHYQLYECEYRETNNRMITDVLDTYIVDPNIPPNIRTSIEETKHTIEEVYH